jgi:long-subunit fatty acid transport protein
MELDIVNWGVSGAYRISENFSLGAGASVYEFEIESTTQRFGVGAFFAPPDFDPANQVSVQTQTGTDTDIGFNLGLQWKFLPKWNLAAVYRQGPEFEYDSTNNGVIVNDTTTFAVPDVVGFGIAVRPTDAMLISFDYDFVEYSALTEEVTSNFVAQPTQDELDSLARIETEDGSELHLGFEYVFLGGTPVAVRVGTWFDPDHKMTFEGDTVALDNNFDRGNAGLFFEGDDEVHVSAGVGVVIGKSFQIDAAVDVSNLINIVSVSGVYRF